jgi:hypothetical protein
MHRRTLLRHGIVGLTGIASGYALVEHSTGSSHASLSMGQLNISGASKTVNDGTIKTVKVDVSGDWSYKLPAGKSPHRWKTTLLITNGDDEAKIDTASDSANYLSNNGDYSISGKLTDTDIYSASDFDTPEGKVKTVTVGFLLLFEVVTTDGKVLARSTLEDTAEVEITHPEYKPKQYGEASGDGSLAIVND